MTRAASARKTAPWAITGCMAGERAIEAGEAFGPKLPKAFGTGVTQVGATGSRTGAAGAKPERLKSPPKVGQVWAGGSAGGAGGWSWSDRSVSAYGPSFPASRPVAVG